MNPELRERPAEVKMLEIDNFIERENKLDKFFSVIFFLFGIFVGWWIF